MPGSCSDTERLFRHSARRLAVRIARNRTQGQVRQTTGTIIGCQGRLLYDQHSAYLEKGNNIGVQIFDRLPFSDERRHKDVHVVWSIQCQSHGIGESADGIVQNEEVLLLIPMESRDQGREDGRKVRLELIPSLFFQCCECGTSSFLYSLVVITRCGQ